MENIKPIIAGNWKMNLTLGESLTLAKKLANELVTSENSSSLAEKPQVIIAPPYPYLHPVLSLLQTEKSSLGVAAQDIHYASNGAFTGKVSVGMIKDLGATHSLVGHSEQRQLFQETNEKINLKIHKLLEANLKAIFCVGETLEERENNLLNQVLREQISQGLKRISTQQMKNVIIAYEPVWAIGTGRNATSQEAEAAHLLIRNIISEIFNKEISHQLSLLYGGSVKASNAADLMGQENINGVLVGGASLKVDEFIKIIRSG